MAAKPKSKAVGAAQHGTQVLQRAIAVIDAVAAGHRDPQAIERDVGTTRSTTHRLISWLNREGFVRQVEGRGLVLGSRLIELGATALAQMPLTSVARPILERLARETGDTIHLSIREGDHIIYVDKIPGTKGLEMRSGVGMRKPLAITGTGKAQMLDLLESEWQRLYKAAKDEVMQERPRPAGFLPWVKFRDNMKLYRSAGYTMESEENQTSISCVAAPIRDARGSVVAGLSIASATPFMPKARMQALVPMIQQGAAEISQGLGFRK